MSSSTPIPVTAVFDIGKTNKKFLLFSQNYEVVYKQQSVLTQAEDEDGYPCEDLGMLVRWVTGKLDSVLQEGEFKITTLNFSTYGASLVHLDGQGKAVTPLYNYLKPYPEDLLQEFYDTYGGREKVSLETASPPMGMLNSGLQLYWLKHRHPFRFENIRYSLHFPQYLSYLFTGECATEYTSIGCHTALWDYKQNSYHQWLKQEDLLNLFPKVGSVSDTRIVSYQNHSFKTGVGIHDSSAALAPYLYALDEPFLLVSTGTWSITLNPFSKAPLTFEELKRDCLCYLNVHGKQVKASRFFLGNEYTHQRQKLDRHFNKENARMNIEPDISLLKKLMRENNPAKKLKLETAHTSGPHSQDEPGKWNPEVFSSYEEAYHQLMLDLVSIQADCIELARGAGGINKLIITGGFSQNDFFVKLLASRFPDKEVYTASLPHASALGAALTVNSGWDSNHIALKELLDLRRHLAFEGLDIKSYFWNRSVAI